MNERFIKIEARDKLVCFDNDLNLRICIKKDSDFMTNKIGEIIDKFLSIGICSDFYDYLLKLSKDDCLKYISIFEYEPHMLIITFDIFSIGFVQNDDIVYFSEPVAFDDLIDTYNSIFDGSVRGSYLFSSTYFSKEPRLVTSINIAGLKLKAENIDCNQLINLYKSKPQGEPLLTIPDDMYKKLTKANLLGIKAIVTGLDGDIPVIKYYD